jgi:hypothetical protein
MRKIGKGRITEDCDHFYLETGQIVDVEKYENGDEMDEDGEIYEEGKTWIAYRVSNGCVRYDVG